MCECQLTVSLKLSESQRFLNTATTDEGGLSKSSNASIRIKSNTMSKKFIHTTCRHCDMWTPTVYCVKIWQQSHVLSYICFLLKVSYCVDLGISATGDSIVPKNVAMHKQRKRKISKTRLGSRLDLGLVLELKMKEEQKQSVEKKWPDVCSRSFKRCDAYRMNESFI